MLMDEPFGAIDPINRERLQNEFLRLQAEIRKTVLFVTHDIDEAIKMGDRIAIMQRARQGRAVRDPGRDPDGPGDEFVEDFVGADRALKRLALMRVADIDLWEAPLAHVGQPTAEVRAKLAEPDVEVPYPLLVDSERRPLGWLSERDLAGDTVPGRPDSPLGPVLDRDDVMRDALADLLQGEAQYAAVTDHDGRIAGVLSVEIISEFLESPEAKTEEHSAAERPHELARALCAARRRSRRRASSKNAAPTRCPARRTDHLFCWDWARENIDRYETPTLQHLELVVISVLLGFAIAFALALLAHRRRWLQPPLLAATGDPLHDPQRRLLLPAATDHRPRPRHRDHRPQRLHAADHLPQHDRSGSPTCPTRSKTRRGAWA